MNNFLFAIVIFSLSAGSLSAQTAVEFDEKNFADRKAFKEANRHYEKGNAYFTEAREIQGEQLKIFLNQYKYMPNGIQELEGAGSQQFKMAMDEYIQANAFNPNSAVLNYRMAVCYFNIPNQKTMGLLYIEKAVKINPSVDPEVQFYFGRLNHLSAQWDKAITAYRSYNQSLQNDPAKNREKIDDMARKIQECVNGKEMEKNPQRVFIDNVGAAVNTEDPEYIPLIIADESVLMFTSRRETSTGGKKDPSQQYYEDIYMSTMVNGRWGIPVNLGKPINGDDHDATSGLSPDGQTLFIYRHTNNGDIYESDLKGTKWSDPEKLGKNINSSGHESSASLSFDGKKLFFVSDREGGHGHRDIWYSTKDAKSRWGPSVNLGQPINTKYGEEGVFMHQDGKTIYFSSQGHTTMGGYDIFKSEFKDGKWGAPVNLGWPINGPDDDVFFVISADGKHGYYASNKMEGYGEKDIYKITFLGAEKPLALSNEDNLLSGNARPVKSVEAAKTVEIKTAQVTLLKGTVTDKLSKMPVGASIELVDNTMRMTIATFTANSSTGKFLVSLPSGKNYGIAVKADGYLFHSENFDIPASENYQEITKDIELGKIDVGSTIVLRNVFFDYNKSTLKPESFTELDRLVKVMVDNPTIRIELSGHTDATGTDEHNQKLSEDRAKSCTDYLISKGIGADRLQYAGYGESKPIDSNDTEKGRAVNRRTEFKILSR